MELDWVDILPDLYHLLILILEKFKLSQCSLHALAEKAHAKVILVGQGE